MIADWISPDWETDEEGGGSTEGTVEDDGSLVEPSLRGSATTASNMSARALTASNVNRQYLPTRKAS
jgi:hypothetical protein